MKSLWVPCPLFLRACHPATMTRPKTATSLDTMTCLQYGILHHLHPGARTAEEPAWYGRVPVNPARSRAWTSRPRTHILGERRLRMALLPPRETLVGKVSNLPFPAHCSSPPGCGHELVGRMLLLKSDFRLIFLKYVCMPRQAVCVSS